MPQSFMSTPTSFNLYTTLTEAQNTAPNLRSTNKLDKFHSKQNLSNPRIYYDSRLLHINQPTPQTSHIHTENYLHSGPILSPPKWWRHRTKSGTNHNNSMTILKRKPTKAKTIFHNKQTKAQTPLYTLSQPL